jgi:hypothetical protein
MNRPRKPKQSTDKRAQRPPRELTPKELTAVTGGAGGDSYDTGWISQ